MTMTPEKAQELLDGAALGPWYLEPVTRKTQRQRYVKSADHRFVADALPDALAIVLAAPDLARAYIEAAAEIARLRAKVDAADKLVEAGTIMADALIGDYIVPGSAKKWNADLTAYKEAWE